MTTTEEFPAEQKKSQASRLTEAEELLLKGYCEDERKRFWQAASWLAAGVFFLWLCWDSKPIGFSSTNPSLSAGPLHKEIARLPGWLLGAYWVWRAAHTAFFDRKRRLLAKLAVQR